MDIASGTYAWFQALAAHFWISWERAVLRARVIFSWAVAGAALADGAGAGAYYPAWGRRVRRGR